MQGNTAQCGSLESQLERLSAFSSTAVTAEMPDSDWYVLPVDAAVQSHLTYATRSAASRFSLPVAYAGVSQPPSLAKCEAWHE